MEDSKLYSAQDIEKLKRKIAVYRDTLTTLKTGSSFEDYLFMKDEFQVFKTKINHLEGLKEVIDEKQNRQIKEYKQQINSLTDQIDSLNHNVEELNQEISTIMNKMKNNDGAYTIEEIKTLPDLQGSIGMSDKNEKKFIIEGTSQINEHSSFPSIQNSNSPLSYKQLQKFVNRLQSMEELSNGTVPSKRNTIPKNAEEVQRYFGKPNTPLNSVNQLPNDLHKYRYGKSAMRVNHPLPTLRYSVKYSEANSFRLLYSPLATNDAAGESFDQDHNIASIEEDEETIEMSQETERPETSDPSEETMEQAQMRAPIEEKEATMELSQETKQPETPDPSEETMEQAQMRAPIEEKEATMELSQETKQPETPDTVSYPEQERNVAPFEESEMSMGISKETKQQETKNDGLLSFFKLFRKSN